MYSVIYGEVNVSVEKCVEINGDYVEKYQSCFISVTLKSWSGRKIFGPYCVYLQRSSIENDCCVGLMVRNWIRYTSRQYNT